MHLLDTTKLKSKNYYLLAVLARLRNLQVLKLYKHYADPAFGSNGLNYLKKGLLLKE